MKIRDYESGRTLTDIDIILSRDEAEELSEYLHRLLSNPTLKCVQLSNVEGIHVSAEVSVTLEGAFANNPAHAPIQSV
jgi:hypothetical protein